jgi:hypothetical protein
LRWIKATSPTQPAAHFAFRKFELVEHEAVQITNIGAMAELDRNIIRERVLAGMEHARRNETKSGKAEGWPKADLLRKNALPRKRGCRMHGDNPHNGAARPGGSCHATGQFHDGRLELADRVSAV